MPGVLIVEALAQVSGILGFIMNNENQVKVLCSFLQVQRKFALKASCCRRPAGVKIRIGHAETWYLQI
jgi:3-hydroxymyristoyl/3-hydroxydecanoyl-(acyl carrier protein) dehydratase